MAFSNFNPESDIPDLHGKVILVTGGKPSTLTTFEEKAMPQYLFRINQSLINHQAILA